MSRRLALPVALLAAAFAFADGPADNIPDKVRPVPPLGIELPEADTTEIKAGLAELQGLIKDIGKHDLLPDVEIYEKAVRYAVTYREVFDAKGIPAVKKVLKEGLDRAKLLKNGMHPWTMQSSYVVRGYRSRIDGSSQPYGLFVPRDYQFQPGATGTGGDAKHRLDFWWHGRGEVLSEVNFMANPQNASGIIPVPGQFILYPYGRYCNANKFAGEVDTFECLDHAKKNYRIDESRLVARGFSMGGAACWQYAVHFPTLWCANAPGAGFSETPEFLRVFQKEDTSNAPWYEKKLWRMYNATDYAVNIVNLPTVAYSGEIDSQKQAADIMESAMAKEGLKLTHIIGPKTGHSYEKGAKEEVNRRIDEFVVKGKPADLAEFKFVTYTLRYNRCAWIEVAGLDKHWERATVEGKKANGLYELTTNGVNRLRITATEQEITIKIDGKQVLTEKNFTGKRTHEFYRVADTWTLEFEPSKVFAKRPGLQGPIDDAFMDSFIMVTPTSKPGEWVDTEMRHAIDHWRKQFRGDAVRVSDTYVTKEMIANSNLILWGDPKSNSFLRKIADKLPVKWTDDGIELGGVKYTASHVPVMIYPNPLNPKKYIVLNSGFTFREYDYLNNARQAPKLPDYAIIDTSVPPNARFPGKVVRAGFFGEKWELLKDDGK